MEGPNKLLLQVDGKAMIEHSYVQLASAGVNEVIIVTGRDEALIRDSLKLRGQDRFIHNESFALGMTTSIQKGVEIATGDAFMICLADMPLLTATHYNHLIAQFHNAILNDAQAILLPSVNGKRGNPVIFSASYKSTILAHNELNGCRKLVKDNSNHLTEYITDDPAYLRDIDTVEDYRQLNL